MNNILNKFQNFELKQEDKIPAEDKETCEKIQSIYENALSTYKKWYNIYQETSKSVNEHNYYGLKIKDLSICEVIQDLHENLIYQIYNYFSSKYHVEIINNYSNKNKYDYNYSNNTINIAPLDYKVYVDDILKQLNGLDFKSLRINQLKEKVKYMCKNRYSNEWEIEIKGNTIKFNDLLSWGYWGTASDKLLIIESALSWFEFEEETKIPEFNYTRNMYYIKWDEINPIMELSTKKIKSIKFFKNGKMDIKFSSPEIARKFISEWCGYPLNESIKEQGNEV